ncbi:MAG: Lrp/AsnC family transcriptional regulator [SAR202 cluster bacterium]|mgnify:FL=1|nr:AsnC family transcriptional regulator [Chloroflexota bacterium]MQG36101.1 Lrp/AsnC family transcriptional regulator [SAR202 cluster bacterium]MQG85668.1 Lrp/AsnC family transcriptional regulator [SAR202 cluster bacterium]|tara:strand:- start:13929 stop:14369 length:441 start_codon:yes stop_codon:yes gene_type:complete
MDDLDVNIINLLQLDGRASNAKIAREAGVSEGTIRRRLKKLIEDGYLSVIAIPNLDRLGFATTAMIGIQTEPGMSEKVATTISELEQAHYVAVTTGSFDVFVWVGTDTAENLGSFLREQVGVINGVQRTETFVNLSIKKRTSGLVI